MWLEIEFDYLTSMNSMAELIYGQTWHSFFGVGKINQYGEALTTGEGLHGEHGVNKSFLEFERLRWLFIDECSTLGCEPLAFGDDRAGKHIRDSHIWALRKRNEKRCFGGLNLCFSGDLWQFRPIKLTPIYDNPF